MIWRRIHPRVGRLLVIVGGQCRKVGKSALVADLIRAFPERRWTAVKITPYAEDGCPVKGARCKCASFEHLAAIREEKDQGGRSDTARFLAAGAKKALWVQTKAGRLGDALSELEKALAGAAGVMIESDALVKFWRPDLFMMVLDPRRADFKSSARAAAQFANGFVLRSPDFCDEQTRNAAGDPRPRFLHPLGHSLPARMQSFVRQHFRAPRHLKLGCGGVFLVDRDRKVQDNVSLRV
jgi:hypothetical protein